MTTSHVTGPRSSRKPGRSGARFPSQSSVGTRAATRLPHVGLRRQSRREAIRGMAEGLTPGHVDQDMQPAPSRQPLSQGDSAGQGPTIVHVGWSEVAQLVVAGATLLLAIGTFWMAKETRKMGEQTRMEAQAVVDEVQVARAQVDATNSQAESARAALATSIQPWLTKADDRQVNPDGSVSLQRAVVGVVDAEIVISFLLRNVGSGIALLNEAVLRGRTLGTSELMRHPYRAFFTVPVLQPGEETAVVFHWTPHGSDPARAFDELSGRPGVWGEFYVDVLYTDAGGGQATWAIIHLTPTSATADSWVVHAISYRRDGEETPLAHVEFLS